MPETHITNTEVSKDTSTALSEQELEAALPETHITNTEVSEDTSTALSEQGAGGCIA